MLQVKQHIYRAHHIRVSQLKSNLVSAITTSELVNKMFLWLQKMSYFPKYEMYSWFSLYVHSYSSN